MLSFTHQMPATARFGLGQSHKPKAQSMTPIRMQSTQQSEPPPAVSPGAHQQEAEWEAEEMGLKPGTPLRESGIWSRDSTATPHAYPMPFSMYRRFQDKCHRHAGYAQGSVLKHVPL